MPKIQSVDQLKNFDYIIAITRGGLIPSFLVARLTNIRNIDTFICQSYTDDHQKHSINHTPKDYSHLKNKKILVIDELVETGDTLAFVVQKLMEFQPESIKTFVVFRKDTTTFEPDFYIKDVSKEWIYFKYDEVGLEDIIGYIAK
jgi:hypoxanthine phosphoribosyltransferase